MKKILVPLALAFLCGCHKSELPPATPAPATPAAIVSAEKTSFDEVTSKLDKGGSFYLYLSTAQALNGISDRVGSMSNFVGALPSIDPAQREIAFKALDVLAACVKDSGVEQISGIGMSSIAREPGFYYSKIIVHHYPGQDAGLLWSIFGKTPHPLQELDLLPETTVLAVFSDLDAPLLWHTVEKHLQEANTPAINTWLQQWPDQFKKATGLDFDQTLASLGGDYGLILTLDPQKKITLPIGTNSMEVPTPGLAIVMKVNSDIIFDRVDALSRGNPLVARVDTPELKMRSMALPLPLPLELRPSIARSGDYLLLANSDALIQDILAVKSGKAKGFKSTAEFARLSQGIPDQGNNLWLVGDELPRAFMQIQQQSLTNKGTMTPEQVEQLQHMFNKGTNFGNYSVGANGPEGFEGFANGNQGAQSAALIPVVAVVGMVAAIAVPNFVRARATAQKNQCINNLQLIDAAKQQWALEKGKQSTDRPTMGDLIPYLNKVPVCPDHGVYTIGAVGEKPTCSVADHVLP